MTAPERMRVWGAGVSGGYVLLGVAGEVLDVPRAGLLFGLCALLTFVLALVAAPRLRPRRGEDGDGGLGAPRDDDPPPWWPEFEREFRAYADRLTSVRRRP
jgi:hypothetical protein